MVLSNVIVGITISCRSFVFSQSRAKVSAGLTNVSGLTVAAFETAHCLCAGLGHYYVVVVMWLISVWCNVYVVRL